MNHVIYQYNRYQSCFWLWAFLVQVGPEVLFGRNMILLCCFHFVYPCIDILLTIFVLYLESVYYIWYVLSTTIVFLSASMSIYWPKPLNEGKDPVFFFQLHWFKTQKKFLTTISKIDLRRIWFIHQL